AVGHALQADRLLELHDLGDGLVFHLAQLARIDLAPGLLLAGFEQVLGAKEAADMVVAGGKFHHFRTPIQKYRTQRTRRIRKGRKGKLLLDSWRPLRNLCDLCVRCFAFQRSNTNTGDFAREQQGVNWSCFAFSSSVKYMSR